MRDGLVLILIGLGGVVLAAGEQVAVSAGCPIVPPPKEYNEKGGTARLLGPDQAAIVIGTKASEPEKYAAERLATLIERRFKRRLPVVTEDKAGEAKQTFALGQASTCDLVKKLCEQEKIDLAELAGKSSSQDGFAIEVLDGGKAVLVAGSNGRGVLYGADAFFDLLRAEGGEVVFPLVSLRDWPSISWRGRAWYQFREYLRPADLDAYVRARLNWVDFRDGSDTWRPHATGRGGPYGIPPGFQLDKALSAQTIKEAHRRGFFVYGTVSCGVTPDKFDAVVKTAEELVALGVDGLWISFDDAGSGEVAESLIRTLLELGKGHGMTGRKIATTSPMPDYTKIKTAFHQAGMKIPGFASATWFFTRVPCERDVKEARDIGLQGLPAWWHNWPRVPAGLLHRSYVGASIRADDKPAYRELTPLRTGWGDPDYDKLRAAHEHTDTVMMWGDGAPEYVTGVLGLWAWEPARHDWDLTQKAIRSCVFGLAQSAAVAEFDARLSRLHGHFAIGRPSRLRAVAERPATLTELAGMEALLKQIEADAPAATLLDPMRLEALFLEPMRATLTYARKMTELDYPEYSLAGLNHEMLVLINQGQTEEAQKKLDGIREQVTAQVEKVAAELAGLEGVDQYAKDWKERVAGVGYYFPKLQPARASIGMIGISDFFVFSDKTEVTLTCSVEGAEIRYTLDGSDPTINSKKYTSPIQLTRTTTIKAKAFKTQYSPSAVTTITLIKTIWGEPFPVEKASHPVVIDGDLKEWEEASPVVIDCSMCSNAEGLFVGNKDRSMLAYFMWDEQNLYIAARIIDDKEVYGRYTGGDIYKEDTVEVWVNKCQMGIGRTRDGGPYPWVWPSYIDGVADGVPSSPKSETHGDIRAAYKLVKDLGSSKAMKVLAGTPGGSVKGGCGRIMECAIPHATSGLEGKAGVTFRLAIGLDDSDPDERWEQIFWPRHMRYGNPDTFQPAILSE